MLSYNFLINLVKLTRKKYREVANNIFARSKSNFKLKQSKHKNNNINRNG